MSLPAIKCRFSARERAAPCYQERALSKLLAYLRRTLYEEGRGRRHLMHNVLLIAGTLSSYATFPGGLSLNFLRLLGVTAHNPPRDKSH